MQTVTVATFNEPGAAERVRAWLETAGIPTRVSNQRVWQRIWFAAKPYASVHLDVEKGHYLQANALLAEWQGESGALAEAIRCPNCGSLRLEYPHVTRKFILPGLIALLLTRLHILKHKFFCQECQHTWEWPSKAGSLPINAPH